MRKRIFGLALVFSGFLLCVVGISHSDAASLKNSIVGKWIREEWHALDKNVEFLKDGTFIDGGNVSDYRFIDENRLRVTGPRGTGMLFEGSVEAGAWLLRLKVDENVTYYYVSEKDKNRRQLLADHYAHQGVRYLGERPLHSAIARFNKAIELDPNLFKGYVGLASAYSLKGDEENACYWLSEAVKKAKNLDQLKWFIIGNLNFSDEFKNSDCYTKILGANFPN